MKKKIELTIEEAMMLIDKKIPPEKFFFGKYPEYFKRFCCGDLFVDKYSRMITISDIYMLSCVGRDKFALIGLETGNRWIEPWECAASTTQTVFVPDVILDRFRFYARSDDHILKIDNRPIA